MLGEWVEIAKAAVQGIIMAGSVIGAMAYFHRERGKAQAARFDTLDANHLELKKTVTKLDGDFDGLTGQLSSIVNDVERRFLTREEGTQAINRLDGNIVELNRSIGKLNDNLFELARDRGGA